MAMIEEEMKIGLFVFLVILPFGTIGLGLFLYCINCIIVKINDAYTKWSIEKTIKQTQKMHERKRKIDAKNKR